MIATIDSTLERYYELADLTKERVLTKEEKGELDLIEGVLIKSYSDTLTESRVTIFKNLPHNFYAGGIRVGRPEADPLFCTRRLVDLRHEAYSLDEEISKLPKRICPGSDRELVGSLLKIYALNADLGNAGLAERVNNTLETYNLLVKSIVSDDFIDENISLVAEIAGKKAAEPKAGKKEAGDCKSVDSGISGEDCRKIALEQSVNDLIQLLGAYKYISGDDSVQESIEDLREKYKLHKLSGRVLDHVAKNAYANHDAERARKDSAGIYNEFLDKLRTIKSDLDEKIAGFSFRDVAAKIKDYIDSYREDIYPDLANRQRQLLSQFRDFCGGNAGSIDPCNIDYGDVARALKEGKDFSAFEREYLLRGIVSHPGYKEFAAIVKEVKAEMKGIYAKLKKAEKDAANGNGKNLAILEQKKNARIDSLMKDMMDDDNWGREFDKKYPFACIGNLRSQSEYGAVNFAKILEVPEERAAEMFPDKQYTIDYKGIFERALVYITENKSLAGKALRLFGLI